MNFDAIFNRNFSMAAEPAQDLLNILEMEISVAEDGGQVARRMITLTPAQAETSARIAQSLRAQGVAVHSHEDVSAYIHERIAAIVGGPHVVIRVPLADEPDEDLVIGYKARREFRDEGERRTLARIGTALRRQGDSVQFPSDAVSALLAEIAAAPIRHGV